MLVALTACKNNVKETAGVIDLPRAETPDSVAKAMNGFFEQAAADSMDIHSVMIVRDGSVIYSHWQSEGACQLGIATAEYTSFDKCTCYMGRYLVALLAILPAFDNTMTKKETNKFIVQIIASVATAILTALGATSCVGA